MEPDEATTFLGALLRAAEDPGGRVHVLVTMRADFYDRPLADPRLGRALRRERRQRHPARTRRARGGRHDPRPPGRRRRGAPARRPPDRRRRGPAERPSALPVRADRAVRRAVGTGARPRELRADRRRPQGRGPPRRVDLHATSTAPSSRPCASCSCASRRCRARRSGAGGFRPPSSPPSTSTWWRSRAPSTRSPATDCSRSTGTPRRAAPTVEVAHEALLAEWHRLRDWIEESRDDLTTHARLVVALQRVGGGGTRRWLPAERDAPRRLRVVGVGEPRMQLTQGETAFLEASIDAPRGRRARRRAARGDGATAAPPDPLAARRPLHVRRAARRHRRLSDPHRRRTTPSDRRSRSTVRPRTRAASTSSSLAGSSTPPKQHGLEAVVLEPPYSSIDRAAGRLARTPSSCSAPS